MAEFLRSVEKAGGGGEGERDARALRVARRAGGFSGLAAFATAAGRGAGGGAAVGAGAGARGRTEARAGPASGGRRSTRAPETIARPRMTEANSTERTGTGGRAAPRRSSTRSGSTSCRGRVGVGSGTGWLSRAGAGVGTGKGVESMDRCRSRPKTVRAPSAERLLLPPLSSSLSGASPE